MLVYKKAFFNIHKAYFRYIPAKGGSFSSGERELFCNNPNCYHMWHDYYAVRLNPYNSWYARDSYRTICPFCGERILPGEEKIVETNEWVSDKFEFAIYAFKNKVKFIVKGFQRKFTNEIFCPAYRNVKEEFSFDVLNKKTTWKQMIRGESNFVIKEIGNPYDGYIFKESILKDCNKPSKLYNSNEITKINKIIRESLLCRMETVHKIKKNNSWYKDYRSLGIGQLLPSLVNYAFKMYYPQWENAQFKHAENIFKADLETLNLKTLGNILPKVKPIKEILNYNVDKIIDIYTLRKLGLTNIDLINKHWRKLNYLAYNKYLNNIFLFSSIVREYVSEKKIFSFLIRDDEYSLDTVSMFLDLSLDGQAKAISKLKLLKVRDWHDEIMYIHRDEYTGNFNLDIPDEIKKRFFMQKDTLKLFIPSFADELKDVGELMHICVGGYAKRVKQKNTLIAFLSNDKGNVVCAIEIKNNKIVQAKLKRNKALKVNKVLNDYVLEWARKNKLSIDTHDVDKTIEFKEQEQITVA